MFPWRLPVPGQPYLRHRRSHFSYCYHPHSSPMTQAPSTTTEDASFQSLFNDAMKAYNQKTNGNITSDPLFTELGPCTSADEILAVLHQRDQDLSASRSGAEGLTKWLTPTINVLYALSATIGLGVGLVFPPANVIFTGIGVLLLAAKDVNTSRETLADLFSRIERFFVRLETYINVPSTMAMKRIIVEIMVEVLSILAIATKEIKRPLAVRYFKKLIGKRETETALQKLDALTQEEARMAQAELRKDAHDIKRNQLRDDLRICLSPPDPSTNHNTACDSHHEGTAEWFLQGCTFREWKSSGSFLWIHGKPGSGKSIICSAIIQDIMALRDTGKAFVAYFYFDFRDVNKQSRQSLLHSLLIQFSAQSNQCGDILSNLYSKHDHGSRKPSDGAMVECLKEMLSIAAIEPTYIIIDALDECPHTSGVTSPRKHVLNHMKELVGLRLANLHICVTSRPEIDIRSVLESLTQNRVSLHTESGQQEDIIKYVQSVVYSDDEMRRWKEEDKTLVIRTLSEKADGMFRWVYCQLEVLRQCLPPSVRCVLKELPTSLDETYLRILREINEVNRELAHRLLQCLTVAVRPLRVEELAEVLAIDFKTEGTPMLNTDLRWEGQEDAVFAACSTLVEVVDEDGTRVVQFSHFSVKEFLTSHRLSISSEHVSRYHILHESAHTTLAQVCLGVLLRLDDDIDKYSIKGFPLAQYAAEHWVSHVRPEDVSPRVKDGMRCLFDVDKPHFAVWLWIYNPESWFSMSTMLPEKPQQVPLYHAAKLGLRDIVECLLTKNPEDVNAKGGSYVTPLHAALSEKHYEVTWCLLAHVTDVDIRGIYNRTPLHLSSRGGCLEIGQWLLSQGADVNAKDTHECTPLLLATSSGNTGLAQMLLEHNAEVHVRDKRGWTPLHRTAWLGHLELARMLLENHAEVNAQGEDDWTPLHMAAFSGHLELARVLLEHNAEVNALDEYGWTPLLRVANSGHLELAQMLLKHNADVNSRDKDGWTPLLRVAFSGHLELAQRLLEYNAEVNAKDEEGWTPLLRAAYSGHLELARMLLEHNAEANAQYQDGWTPLHWTASLGHFDLSQMLLEHNADVNIRDEDGWTPLHTAAFSGHLESAQMLLEHNAEVNAQDKDGWTPLLRAASSGHLELARVLLKHNAKVNIRYEGGWTPLLRAASSGHLELARMLLEHNAEVNARYENGWTSLHWAISSGHLELTRLLLEHNAECDARYQEGWTPLHQAAFAGHLEIAQILLEHNAQVNAQDRRGSTPLHQAALRGHPKLAQILLEHHAEVNAQDHNGLVPLHHASREGHVGVVRLLLEYGANLDLCDSLNKAPSSAEGQDEIVQVLSQYATK